MNVYDSKHYDIAFEYNPFDFGAKEDAIIQKLTNVQNVLRDKNKTQIFVSVKNATENLENVRIEILKLYPNLKPVEVN